MSHQQHKPHPLVSFKNQRVVKKSMIPLKEQAVIEVLMEENSKEASALESLLAEIQESQKYNVY